MFRFTDLFTGILYRPSLNELTGGVLPTIFFTHLCQTADERGWADATPEVIYEALRMSPEEQEEAKRMLRERGLIDEEWSKRDSKLYIKPTSKEKVTWQ